ncbi:MAG: galactokinase [Pyrinomonadaceae bacterium]
MINVSDVEYVFRELHGGEPRLFSAPGRVNLIGEHTDYNDGFVLPLAIDRHTVVAANLRDDRKVLVRTLNLNESAEFDLDQAAETQRGRWINYIEGVARSLEARGVKLRGANLVLQSDVPVGAGLSSSAALEVSVALALATLSGAKIDKVALALVGQAAEHHYVGIKSGIMDQFIAALGEAGHALLIDCRALSAEAVPLDTRDALIVICDTRVKHELAASAYNERRAECERGVVLLRQFLPDIKALRDVSVAEFEKYEARLPEPVRARCRHVVTENARTLAAAAALRQNDLAEVGRLMYESHRSLRDDYEVSCRELDVMVEIASSIDGVIGARMTGGGFGGCTVNLVRRSILKEFEERITREYKQATSLDPFIYETEASEGAKEIVA